MFTSETCIMSSHPNSSASLISLKFPPFSALCQDIVHWNSQTQSLPMTAVSWEIKMSDLEGRILMNSAPVGRKCNAELKWYATDEIKCIEFSGIINTGIRDIAVEMKRCIQSDLCKEMITSYMGFPITNKSRNCKSAIRSGARIRAPSPIFFVLFLRKLLH
ncbi:hypothetical protein AAY473_021101 [Plecturocebus cupreus]